MANPTEPKVEPFPALSPIESVPTDQQIPQNGLETSQRPDTGSNATYGAASTTTNSPSRRRTSSIRQSFLNSNPPLGMWQATGEVTSKVPSLAEIRNGSFAADGWSHEGQLEGRGTNPHEIHRRRLARTSSASTRTRASSNVPPSPITPTITERASEDHGEARMYFPRRGSFAFKEPVQEENTQRAGANVGDMPSKSQQERHATVAQLPSSNQISEKPDMVDSSEQSASGSDNVPGPDETGTYPNGYRFPAKHTWWQSTTIGSKAFGRFVLTPFGFLITIYGLNVVAWGAMIFFLLLNAAPAMCNPSCSDKHHSARQIWIEIDSQVLNALFCVTGFGLIPWRFRDFYYLMRWRVWKDYSAHRILAGLYRGWYRLPGSEKLPDYVAPPPVYTKKHPRTDDSPPPYSEVEIAELEANPAIPLPATAMPDPPLTGLRAQPSRSWTLDFVIWMYMWNTILQCFLAGFMWGYNRFNRPSWAVGLFITLGCLTGIFAGICVFIEGKKVKKAEGIPIQEYDVLESVEEFQDRKQKEEEKLAKKESKHERRSKRTEKVKGHMWFTRS
ncbi:uncharacterized protein HMPREF1541_08490 [Cyphellophora europaea CBS 101466]|uniref:Uncharacterized protein n=1 Tax=Cyphellophora europaea (strain CBS 101466) TaxID=1220924 RepID=W2RKG3_CYPE1|nr:uncharacterized protein HMPREF1541_08490 [Cyphellophora europaea CBS 101466]ETN36213.1 hypothetical protein HMPREF1541_08490 [Cyphellophora europaea CBS 101466]